ncbi:MAG: Lipoteichoic acid synthase [Firmicutes bacterium ADurb.Bin182]|nr:MAG: Lipoteichoic acid synthase [Firmicutes bacterium ADurb.Bin182]
MKRKRAKGSGLVLNIFIYALLIPAISVFIAELMWRGSVADSIGFLTGGVKQFLYGFCVLAGLSTMAVLLFSHPFASVAAVCAPFLLIAAGNAFKMAILEYPAATCNVMMLFYDLPLTMIESPLLLLIFAGTVIGLIVLSALFFKRAHYSDFNIPGALRWLTFSIVSLLVVLLLINPLVFLKGTKTGAVEVYKENGLIGSIVLLAHRGSYEKPETIPEEPQYTGVSAQNKPDIILVKLEAFTESSDYSSINGGLTPAFDSLKQESISGSIFVNTFGGNTTATVFEVLSGYSTAFSMPGSTAFGDFLRGKDYQKSLIRPLKEQGYATAYISSSLPHFTNEKNAVTALGFDRFISIKDFPKMKGNLPDSVLADRIISEYEKMQYSPVMLCAMTMENHYDYNINKYSNITYVMPSQGNLSAIENQILSGYLNGIHNADILVKNLTDYFRNVERDVYVVLFSDHRPSLGFNYGIYKKLGLISSETTPAGMPEEEHRFLHSVPFMIWSNKGMTPRTMEMISPSYLLPILFEEAGVEGNDVSAFLQFAMKTEDNFGTSAYPYSSPDRKLADIYRYICRRDIIEAR